MTQLQTSIKIINDDNLLSQFEAVLNTVECSNVETVDLMISIAMKKLVPNSGPSETLEGELIRAVNKMIYRKWNDGDYCHTGYGVETCGACAMFLYSKGSMINGLKTKLNELFILTGEHYDKCLYDIAILILKYVLGRVDKNEYSRSTFDMYDFQDEAYEKFGYSNDDEHDYDSDEYYGIDDTEDDETNSYK